MSDPFTVAASTAGLVSLGLEVVKDLYNYYTSYRSQDRNVESTRKKLGDLLQILETIAGVLQTRRWRPDEKSILDRVEDSIARCDDAIQELREENDEFRKDSGKQSATKTMKLVGRRALYPLRESTLKKLNEDIGDIHDNLITALETLQLKEHQNTQKDVDKVKNIVLQIQNIQIAATTQSWLNAADATIDFNTAANTRYANTGDWFVKSKAFRNWLQQENTFLWLHGFAGCGKSVLCSTAIQHSFRQQRSQPGSAVAFFFFTFNDMGKQDSQALLKALLTQLSGQIPDLDRDLERLRKLQGGGSTLALTMMEYLRDAIERSHNTFILLDALDECPVQDSRNAVLSTIETMRKWSLPNLHLLVTSRDYPDVRDVLRPNPQESISMDNSKVRDDILHYIKYCLENDPLLWRWKDERQMIKNYLVEHSNGVFRWVQCQIEPLRRCPGSKALLRKCLKSLPSTLEETYERMLCGIDEYLRDHAQQILTLLCLTERDLTVAEVIEASAIDVNDKGCYDIDRRLGHPGDLLRICPGLISIISDKGKHDNALGVASEEVADITSSADEETLGLTSTNHTPEAYSSNLVRIAHFSVQEFLLSDRIQNGNASYFAIRADKGHKQIAKTSLIYLANHNLLSRPLTVELVLQYSFASFSARYWPHYYRKSNREVDQDLEEMAFTLFSDKRRFERWARIYGADSSHVQKQFFDETRPVSMSPTFYVSLFGLIRLLKRLLAQSQEDINSAMGEHGQLLHIAAANGHKEIVEYLIDKGANVNLKSGIYMSALEAGAANGHKDIVEYLIEKGANVNSMGVLYALALMKASFFGDEKLVQCLIATGAGVNLRGQNFGHAIRTASDRGHEEIVRMLIEAKADVNAQSDGAPGYRTAIAAAKANGHQKIVEMLIAAGAVE